MAGPPGPSAVMRGKDAASDGEGAGRGRARGTDPGTHGAQRMTARILRGLQNGRGRLAFLSLKSS